LYVNKPRLFPNYPAINYLTNGAGHQYNGLTGEIKRRGGKGLTYQLSYTHARDIGDLERGQSPENAYDRKRERGPWVDIPKNAVTGNVIWEIPVGKGRHLLSRTNTLVDTLAGGWSTSIIYTYHSGRFLTPLWTGPDPAGTVYTTAAAAATTTIRPNCLANGNLPESQRSVNGWFNASAFSAPTPGQFGTCGPGVIFGPSLHVWDAGIFKTLVAKEHLRIRVELTAVNILNHPNYSDPNMNITQAGNVGVITGVGGASNVSGASSPLDPSGARAYRSGLRIEF